jgi:hypothetical protein
MRWRWQSGLVSFFLFFASGAGAAPCTTANADCTEWIEIAGGQSRVLVYRTFPLSIKNDTISRALIMVHGQGRDANNYFRHAFGAAFFASVGTLSTMARFHRLMQLTKLWPSLLKGMPFQISK